MVEGSNQTRYDTLYENAKKFFLNSTSGKLNVANITALIRFSMQIVQQWTNVNGPDKKEIVLEVINDLVEDLINDESVVGVIDDKTKADIMGVLATAPLIIDMAVAFAKTYSSSKSNQQKKCCF